MKTPIPPSWIFLKPGLTKNPIKPTMLGFLRKKWFYSFKLGSAHKVNGKPAEAEAQRMGCGTKLAQKLDYKNVLNW